jgi:hypothetical protein
MPIVYKATDTETDEFYVGFSGHDDLYPRQREHEKESLRTVPRYRFERALKGRLDKFEWTILQANLSVEWARVRERHFVRELRPTLNGNAGGGGAPNQPKPHRRMLLPITPIPGEEWRSVPGFEGYYEVSDHGRVKTLRRIVDNPIMGTMVRREGLLRTPIIRSRPRVTLCRDGKEYNRKVQLLVAEAFIGPRPEGLGVLHRDDDKLNNRPSNLYYGTDAENAADRTRNGGGAFGERSGNVRITEAIAREILRLDTDGVRQAEIVRRLGIPKGIVANIRRGRSWRHLGGQPKPVEKREYPAGRAVVCLNTGSIYNDIEDAAKQLGILPNKIANICDPQASRISVNGLVFRFYGEHEGCDARAIIAASKVTTGRQKRPIICLNDARVFLSMSQAATEYGLTVSQVSEVARGNKRHARGLRFAIAEELS